jgi:hypothetical protein
MSRLVNHFVLQFFFSQIWRLTSREEHRLIIVLMMEAARTSEMSVDIQLRTRQYIPEDSELQIECLTADF